MQIFRAKFVNNKIWWVRPRLCTMWAVDVVAKYDSIYAINIKNAGKKILFFLSTDKISVNTMNIDMQISYLFKFDSINVSEYLAFY